MEYNFSGRDFLALIGITINNSIIISGEG